MSPIIKILFCAIVLSGLTACKIELNIFGKGSVATESGSFDCTSDGTTQSGDCSQTYNIDPATEETCDPEDEDCTIVEENGSVIETWVATPEGDDTFDGFGNRCDGAGPCEVVITSDSAERTDTSIVEAHFDPEPAPQPATYTYNHKGQMASMTTGGVTTYYLYDLNGNRIEEVNASGETIKTYVYAENELVMWIEKTGDTGYNETEEQVFYPVTNHLGQPELVARQDVEFSHEQYTDPFGKIHATYINQGLGIGPMKMANGLPGQWLQPTGYYDNGWRTYDSGIGYTQPDRLDVLGRAVDPELMVARMLGAAYWEAGPNQLYGYVKQNPVSSIDMYGLDDWWRTSANYRYSPDAGGPVSPETTVALTCYSICVGGSKPGPAVTVTGAKSKRETPNSSHSKGEAFDIGRNSNPDICPELDKKCHIQCLPNGYGQEEENSGPGTHYHHQLRPVEGGKPGYSETVKPYKP